MNVNRGEQGYCPALHCRIPFLSGGLFEPIDGYDWEHNNFNIPNEVFSNAATKGREADGILDIFDRYNFTMSEDEPMEREVAIDPEMLGKVFENLLEVNDRKSKGAFYTPREIVHYMCQESLINYLTNTLQIEEEAIREFILYGDFMKDEDTVKEKRQGNGGMYISESLFKLDAEGKVVVDRLKDVDEALKNVRVADPAVGSGAFPLGMLNEIVRARQNISAYMAITMNAYDTRLMYQMERSPHNLKYETSLSATKKLLYYPDALEEKKYPDVLNHLNDFRELLEHRLEAYNEHYHWTALHRARKESIFIGEKIVVPYRTRTNAFAYNDVEWFCRSDAYVITPKTKNVDLFYLLGVLNSKLNFVWLYNRGKRKGEVLELFQVPLSEIPIIELPTEEKDRVAELAREITYIKRDKPNADTSMMESEIDQILYAAYKLSPTEIDLVEEQAK